MWAKASWSTRSPGPTTWPITVSLVAWPPTNVTESSAPTRLAIARSSSPWIVFSPETSRLAETLVPNRSIAPLAAAVTAGSPDIPR